MTSERSADAPEIFFEKQPSPSTASTEVYESNPFENSPTANPFRTILFSIVNDSQSVRSSKTTADKSGLGEEATVVNGQRSELPSRVGEQTMSLPNAGMKVRMLVAFGAAAPSELVSLLTNVGERQVNIRINGLSQATVAELFKLAVSKELGIRSKVAENRSTPGVVLAKLSRDKDWRVRALVAVNVNTPATVLKMLALDEDEDVVLWVASNPSLPKPLLTELALHKNQAIRKRVAGNRSTSPKALHKLAYDSNSEVRIAVASNQHTPHDALSLLCWDRDYAVRRSVALNPSTSLDLLCSLAVDLTWCVRAAANNVINTKFSDLTLISQTHS